MTSNRVATFDAELLEALYLQATANRTPHGAQKWAAGVLGVTERTVRRWVAGRTAPTRLQVARLRVHARVEAVRRRLRADREAGVGLYGALRRLFGPSEFDEAVEEGTVARAKLKREATTRANRLFDERDRHRNPDRHPFELLWRERGRR